MNLYDIEIKKMNGDIGTLKEHEGKVLLIVNTASKCGFTPQFEGLEELYNKHKDNGLVILGFPCNQFLGQDPGSDSEIVSFCQINYGVTFPMLSKVKVKGKNQHDLFNYLVENSPVYKGKKVKWNFEKFLISREGKIVNRYRSGVKPFEIENDISSEL